MPFAGSIKSAALIAILSFSASVSAAALGEMPAAQQNAMVAKYCAVCHDDAHRNGGISLQHFDAAHADPGVAAMLLSKLTSGLSPQDVEKSRHDPAAAAGILEKMNTGAIQASGSAAPDRPTQEALARSLATEAAGAEKWYLVRTPDQVFSASAVRMAASVKNPGITDMYRLTLTCDSGTHQSEMRLAWASAVPEKGRSFYAAADTSEPVTYTLTETEKMGFGEGTSGPGSIVLVAGSVPLQTLQIGNVFPEETVVFSFTDLPAKARQELDPCFGTDPAARKVTF